VEGAHLVKSIKKEFCGDFVSLQNPANLQKAKKLAFCGTET